LLSEKQSKCSERKDKTDSKIARFIALVRCTTNLQDLYRESNVCQAALQCRCGGRGIAFLPDDYTSARMSLLEEDK
jgi:hypothetical protein